MEAIQAKGRTAVSSLLRELAAEVEGGMVPLPGLAVPIGDDVTARILADAAAGRETRLVVRLSSGIEQPDPRVEVERELSHPGG